MPTPAQSIPTRVGAQSLSTGKSMEPDTHGREAALPVPTLIREDRTRRGKCYVSSWSIKLGLEPQYSQPANHVGSASARFVKAADEANFFAKLFNSLPARVLPARVLPKFNDVRRAAASATP